MIAGSARELTSFARWNETQWRFFERVDDLVRTGRGLDIHHSLDDANSWRSYQRAMFEAARYDAAARAHPPMRSTVIDLPQAVVHSRAVAHDAGLDDIANHRPGDLRIEPIEECDVALLSDFLHHFMTAEVLASLGRVRSALRPRGTIAIWEFEEASPRGAVGGTDLIALFFRLTSSSDLAPWNAVRRLPG